MNRCIYTLILFLVSVVVPVSALAESARIQMLNLTTGKLDKICSQLLNGKQQAFNFDQGLCIGIILGVEDNAHYDKKICVPKTTDITERVLVVNRYITSQPNRASEAFASLAFDAMVNEWPCASK